MDAVASCRAAASGEVLVVTIYLLVRENFGYARQNTVESNAFDKSLGNVRRRLAKLCFGKRGGIAMQRGSAQVNTERNALLQRWKG